MRFDKVKKTASVISAAILALGMTAFGQTAGQDIKAAGTDTKDAAKNTGKATKRTAKTATKKTKNGVHKAANKVSDKTQ
jgi:hypothetical protein